MPGSLVNEVFTVKLPVWPGVAAVHQQRVAARLDGAEQPGAGVQPDSRCVAQGEGKIAGVAAQFDLDLPAHRQIEAVRGVRGAVAELATRGIQRAGESRHSGERARREGSPGPQAIPGTHPSTT